MIAIASSCVAAARGVEAGLGGLRDSVTLV